MSALPVTPNPTPTANFMVTEYGPTTEKDFDWGVPNFEEFANQCTPVPIYTAEGDAIYCKSMCDKYPNLTRIKITTKFPLYAVNARVLEKAYGVFHPLDRRALVFLILRQLFDVGLFSGEKNHRNIEHIFWIEKEERLSRDWGLSMAELEDEIETIEDFKLLYFFRITDMEKVSPFLRRCIKSAIGDDDPPQCLQNNLLGSNAIVGVLAGLILAAVLSLATNSDIGTFGTRFSQIAIVSSSICTCFTFLIIVYSADNVIRLNECPTDKVLEFVSSAFDRRTMADPKFWKAGLHATGYLLNLMCDYLYLLMFSVILVGTALWNWMGVYSQMYAKETYAEYVISVNQNVTEMKQFYRIDQKGHEAQKNINGQFLAICISVMVLVGLLVTRCIWLNVLSGVVAGVDDDDGDTDDKDPTKKVNEKERAKKEAERKKKEEMEVRFNQKPNFGLEARSSNFRNCALKKLILVYFILTCIYVGVGIWALWDSAFWVKDDWKKCCAVTETPTLTPSATFLF